MCKDLCNPVRTCVTCPPQKLDHDEIIEILKISVKSQTMLELLKTILFAATSTLKTRRELALENLALRQQLAVFGQAKKRPAISNTDRCFWILLSRVWKNWAESVIIVKPETVIRWHRNGFKKYWAWKSKRNSVGRPSIDKEIRDMIQKMCAENPSWSVTQIHGQLLKLGYEVSETTVENHMVRKRKPPSETWRTFLHNHANEIIACDFFTVPTVTYRVLSVLVMINHHRRKIVFFNVVENPWSEWVAQQVKNAFPYNSAPRYLLRPQRGSGLKFLASAPPALCRIVPG